jgi:hypothetical protein
MAIDKRLSYYIGATSAFQLVMKRQKLMETDIAGPGQPTALFEAWPVAGIGNGTDPPTRGIELSGNWKYSKL